MKKQRMSPVTKIRVTHFGRIGEKDSEPVHLIKRPKNIYAEAAKRIGAIKISTDCII